MPNMCSPTPPPPVACANECPARTFWIPFQGNPVIAPFAFMWRMEGFFHRSPRDPRRPLPIMVISCRFATNHRVRSIHAYGRFMAKSFFHCICSGRIPPALVLPPSHPEKIWPPQTRTALVLLPRRFPSEKPQPIIRRNPSSTTRSFCQPLPIPFACPCPRKYELECPSTT